MRYAAVAKASRSTASSDPASFASESAPYASRHARRRNASRPRVIVSCCAASASVRLAIQALDVADEAGVFAVQQRGQAGTEIRAPAPLEDVVFPRVPAPRLLGRHVLVVQQQVRALEERQQHVEDDELPLLLLGVERGHGAGGKQPQVRVVERDLEEILVIVRQELVDLFLLVLALLALLEKEHADRERQADDGHDVAHQLPGLERHSTLPRRLVLGAFARRDEQQGGRHPGARGVPTPFRYQHVLAGPLELDPVLAAVALENQRYLAAEKADELITRRVALPARPVGVEGEGRDEHVPLEPGETAIERLEHARHVLGERCSLIGLEDDEGGSEVVFHVQSGKRATISYTDALDEVSERTRLNSLTGHSTSGSGASSRGGGAERASVTWAAYGRRSRMYSARKSSSCSASTSDASAAGVVRGPTQRILLCRQ